MDVLGYEGGSVFLDVHTQAMGVNVQTCTPQSEQDTAMS